MEYRVGDKVRIKTNLTEYESARCYVTAAMVGMEGQVHIIEKISPNHNYKIFTNSGDDYWWFSEEMLEPVASTLAEIKEKKLTCCINVKNIAEAQFLDNFFGCKGYCIKEYTDMAENKIVDDTLAFQLTDGIISDRCSTNFYRSCGGRYGEVYEFSDLFPIGSTMVCDNCVYQRTESGIKNYKLVRECAVGGVASTYDLPISEWHYPVELISHMAGISYENSINKLKTCLSAFPNDGISAKNGGKNTMKFTFYFNVNEGTRVDKSCNGTIPTITTSVVLDKFGDPDRRKCYSLKGEATCDKADYDMRQGVLEALANAVFDGNFEKAYDKAVKTNAFCERQDRTCHYCGKVLDTIEEKQTHEAWHVERKKARRERYLLRKRAKEIAFEEQAQKMAKEIIAENKKEAK